MLLTKGSQGIDDNGLETAPASDLGLHDGLGVATNVGSAVGEPPASTSANIVTAKTTIAVPKDGDFDGTKLTLGQVTLLSGIQISVASDGIVLGLSKATFQDTGASTAWVDEAITINDKVYSFSHLPSQSGAVMIAGHTIPYDGPHATIAGKRITYDSSGLPVIDAIAPITIDGTAHSVSTLSDGAEPSTSSWASDVVKSSASGVQPGSAAPSDPDENSASDHGRGFGLTPLGAVMLLGSLVNL